MAITTGVAAAHVLILVLSKDLGSVPIFSSPMSRCCLLQPPTGCIWQAVWKRSVVMMLAYKLFSHVRVRVEAWQDPWSDIAGKGHQVTQALFAIGHRRLVWHGDLPGMPAIPVVEKDFIFRGDLEELGGIYALCILLICLGCFTVHVDYDPDAGIILQADRVWSGN